MHTDNNAQEFTRPTVKDIEAVSRALLNGLSFAQTILAQGLELTVNLENAPVPDEDVPYRYTSTDSVSEAFLLVSDPGMTDREATLIAAGIIRHLKEARHETDFRQGRLTIFPKP